MLEAKSQQKRTDFRDSIEEMNLIYQSNLAQCSIEMEHWAKKV